MSVATVRLGGRSMSDAAVTVLVSGLVNVATMLVGFLTLWLKLKYGEENVKKTVADKSSIVQQKVDHNTSISTQAADAATKAREHVESCDGERKVLIKGMTDHEKRISALEGQMEALKVSVEGVSKNIDSTRHEMRGHLQTLTNKLDILGAKAPIKEV